MIAKGYKIIDTVGKSLLLQQITTPSLYETFIELRFNRSASAFELHGEIPPEVIKSLLMDVEFDRGEEIHNNLGRVAGQSLHFTRTVKMQLAANGMLISLLIWLNLNRRYFPVVPLDGTGMLIGYHSSLPNIHQMCILTLSVSKAGYAFVQLAGDVQREEVQEWATAVGAEVLEVKIGRQTVYQLDTGVKMKVDGAASLPALTGVWYPGVQRLLDNGWKVLWPFGLRVELGLLLIKPVVTL